jgi:hypothetical protein
MSKQFLKLLLPLAAVSVCLAIPAMASATSVPSLPSGVDRAYLADEVGEPIGGSTTIEGSLVEDAYVDFSCDRALDLDWSVDGTGSVTGFEAINCTVSGFPNCDISVTAAAGSLPWGVRLGYDATAGVFRSYINSAYYYTLASGTPTCPAPAGTYPESGVLKPALGIDDTTLVASFGFGSGSLTGPLGSVSFSGEQTGTVPTGSQLITSF